MGTMELAARSGNLNSMQETGYGCNRWKNSAARQWLNSTQPKGRWWAKQDDWDIAPDQLATKDGFLCGMPSDMLATLKTVKVTTLANTVNDGGVTDITYDRVFLASHVTDECKYEQRRRGGSRILAETYEIQNPY